MLTLDLSNLTAVGESFAHLGRSATLATQAFQALAVQDEQARHKFEMLLSQWAWIRYMTLLEEHPEWGWLDAAVAAQARWRL